MGGLLSVDGLSSGYRWSVIRIWVVCHQGMGGLSSLDGLSSGYGWSVISGWSVIRVWVVCHHWMVCHQGGLSSLMVDVGG